MSFIPLSNYQTIAALLAAATCTLAYTKLTKLPVKDNLAFVLKPSMTDTTNMANKKES